MWLALFISLKQRSSCEFIKLKIGHHAVQQQHTYTHIHTQNNNKQGKTR